MEDDEGIDYSKVDWTEIEEEMEALEVIFPEELTVHTTKPYKLDIVINSNADSEDNYLKMLIILEVPHDYPVNIPFIRLKNLSTDYLDNQMLNEYQDKARVKARECSGGPMIFEVYEELREAISEINDTVVSKFKKIIEQREEDEKTQMNFVSCADHLNYTEVNPETFSAWSTEFLGQLKAQEEKSMSEADLRETGKEWFMHNKSDMNIVLLEEKKGEDNDDELDMED